MVKTFICITFASILLAGNVTAQDKVKLKDVRKNCVAGSYRVAVSMAQKYLKQDPNNFEAHYVLATAYAGRSIEHHEAQQKIAANPKPTDQDYDNQVNELKGASNCADSASFHYEKSNGLIVESFVKKNNNVCKVGMGGCYNEFSGGTLESAQKLITSEAKRFKTSSEADKRNIEKLNEEKAKKK